MKTISSHLATLLAGEAKLRRQLAPFVRYVVLLVAVVSLYGWVFHVIGVQKDGHIVTNLGPEQRLVKDSSPVALGSGSVLAPSTARQCKGGCPLGFSATVGGIRLALGLGQGNVTPAG